MKVAIDGESIVRIDMQHGRKCERDGLATTGLRNGHNISTGQSHRPRLALNWGRFGKALRLDGGHEVIGKPDFIKRSHRSRNVVTLNLFEVVSKASDGKMCQILTLISLS